jgi:hypothetical protein
MYAVLKLQNAQKAFLDSIFRIVVISQNGPADAKDHAHVLCCQSFNPLLWRRSIAGLSPCPNQGRISKNRLFGHFAIP